METWAVVVLVVGISGISILSTFFITRRRLSHSIRQLEKEPEIAREVKEAEPKKTEGVKLDDTERAKLEIEYRECCQDWRWRDKYVLDKLSAAGILFMLLGVALGTIPEDDYLDYLIKLFLLIIGGLFCFILTISVAKDIYYRDGTQKLVEKLAAQLGIVGSLRALGGWHNILLKSKFKSEKLQFPRKISIKPDKSSLVIRWWFPKWLRNFLLNKPTFGLILAFYLAALLIFAILIILILVNWIWKLSLPI